MGRRGVWSANRWHGVLSGISNKGKIDMHLYYTGQWGGNAIDAANATIHDFQEGVSRMR